MAGEVSGADMKCKYCMRAVQLLLSNDDDGIGGSGEDCQHVTKSRENVSDCLLCK